MTPVIVTESLSHAAERLRAILSRRDDTPAFRIESAADGFCWVQVEWALEDLQSAIDEAKRQTDQLQAALLESLEMFIDGPAEEPYCELMNKCEIPVKWPDDFPIQRTVTLSQTFTADEYEVEADLRFELQTVIRDKAGDELIYEATLDDYRAVAPQPLQRWRTLPR